MRFLALLMILLATIACSKKEESVFQGQTRALEKAKQTEAQVLKAVDDQKKLIQKQLQQD